MRVIFFSMLFFIFTLNVFAQEDSNKAIYTGVAEGSDLNAVRLVAMDNLIQQIEVFVSSTGSSVKTEDSSGLHDVFTVQRVSKSHLLLKEVTERVENIAGGNIRVTKSVAKSNIRELFERRKSLIREYLVLAENGLRVPGFVNIGEVLKNYYWAFLLCSITPDTLQFAFTYNSESSPVLSTSIAPSIRNAIKYVVSQVTFNPFQNNGSEEVSWQYQVKYKNKRVDGMHFSYFDGVGTTSGSVKNGLSNMTFYFKVAESGDKDITLTPDFLYEDEMDELLKEAETSVSGHMDAGTLSAKLPGIIPEKKRVPTAVVVAVPPVVVAVPPVVVAVPPVVPSVVVPAEIKPVKSVPGHESIIQKLMAKKNDLPAFMMELHTMEKANLLITGSQSDFETGEGLYALVIEGNNIIAFLSVRTKSYFDLVTNSTVSLKDYSGKKIKWILING